MCNILWSYIVRKWLLSVYSLNDEQIIIYVNDIEIFIYYINTNDIEIVIVLYLIKMIVKILQWYVWMIVKLLYMQMMVEFYVDILINI